MKQTRSSSTARGRPPITAGPKRDSVTFSAIPVQEIPQSVQGLTSDYIEHTGALSVDELLSNVPGSSNSLARTTPFDTASLQFRGQPVVIYGDGLRRPYLLNHKSHSTGRYP